MSVLGRDMHAHAPAPKSSTDFIMYPFVPRKRSTNSLGHGHGYKCHSQSAKNGHARCADALSPRPPPTVRGRHRSRRRVPHSACFCFIVIFVILTQESFFFRMECPAWCSGGRRPLRLQELHPLKLRPCSSQTLRSPESLRGETGRRAALLRNPKPGLLICGEQIPRVVRIFRGSKGVPRNGGRKSQLV